MLTVLVDSTRNIEHQISSMAGNGFIPPIAIPMQRMSDVNKFDAWLEDGSNYIRMVRNIIRFLVFHFACLCYGYQLKQFYHAFLCNGYSAPKPTRFTFTAKIVQFEFVNTRVPNVLYLKIAYSTYST